MSQIGVTYSTLSPSDVFKLVVPQYRIANPISCEFWHRGLNDSYKVQSSDGNFILRVYRKDWRTLPQINFEIETLNYLHGKGANVSYPIARKDDGLVTVVSAPEGVRYAIMTSFAEGDCLSYDDPHDAFLYGKNVAEIHSLTDGYSNEHPRFELDLNHLLVEPLRAIHPFLTHRPDDWKYLEKFGKHLFNYVEGIESKNIDYGFCHGDFHGWNAHKFREQLTFFDFDCCGMGWRAYDMAVFRWGARLREKESECWQGFIEGYNTQRKISETDLTLSVAFLAIRDFWLMGLHMGNSAYFGKAWLDNTYIDRRMKFLKSIQKEHFPQFPTN